MYYGQNIGKLHIIGETQIPKENGLEQALHKIGYIKLASENTKEVSNLVNHWRMQIKITTIYH